MITTILILVLFLIHGIAGGFQLMGIIPGGSNVLSVFAYILMGVITVHMVISLWLTGKSLSAMKRSGVSYGRENFLFWARRISGLAVMIFVFFHLAIFNVNSDGAYRLTEFDTLKLLTQILMVISLLIHVLTNIKPLWIGLGLKPGFKEYLKDILFVLSIVLLFMGIAFVIYYIRWNIAWR